MTRSGRSASDEESNPTGYRQPPKATRFAKGRSGNPAGRPRGRHREAPYDAVLGQMVTIREGGVERRVTGTEAFLLQLAKRGIEGNSAAARASLAVIEEARRQQPSVEALTVIWAGVAPGSVTPALLALRMATKLDPYRETARIALAPWLIEAALARLPEPFSTADQEIIVRATRTPHKVKWPKSWSEHSSPTTIRR